MNLNYVTRHLISGYLPAAAVLALYFLLLRALGRKQTVGRVLVSFVFCFYLIGILTMTGVCAIGSFSPRIVWVPFADMIRGPIDTALNVLLFVPLGLFLPILYKDYTKIGRVAAVGFFISLSVELAQMFGSGITDVNDLITNTLGACLGSGICTLLTRPIPRSRLKMLRAENVPAALEPLLFWAGLILIMLTIQIPLHRALFPVT